MIPWLIIAAILWIASGQVARGYVKGYFLARFGSEIGRLTKSEEMMYHIFAIGFGVLFFTTAMAFVISSSRIYQVPLTFRW